MRASELLRKAEDAILCQFKHKWTIEFCMPWGWSRVYCSRCDTEQGAPYSKAELMNLSNEQIRALGIEVTGG